MKELFTNPFIQGLIIGLLVAIFTFLYFIIQNFKIKRQNMQTKNSAFSQSKIANNQINKLESEIEQMRNQIQNLKNTISTLRQKPGRLEIMELKKMSLAIKVMYKNAPGFAPVWENAMNIAEEEEKNVFIGKIPFLKKLFPETKTNLIENKYK